MDTKTSQSEIQEDRIHAAQRALRDRQEEAYLAGVPIPSEETLRRVAIECGFECPNEVIEKIEEIHAEWDAARKGIDEHTHNSARAAWRKYHDEELAKKDLKTAETFTFEEFQRDFRVKMTTYKQRQKDSAKKAFELLDGFGQDFYACANGMADLIEIEERAQAEKFAIAHQPTFLVLTIRKAAFIVRQRMKSFTPMSGISPKEIAGFLPLS